MVTLYPFDQNANKKTATFLPMNNKHYIICANTAYATTSMFTKLLPPNKDIPYGTLMCIVDESHVDACSKGKQPIGVASMSVSSWKNDAPIPVSPLGQVLQVLIGDAVQVGDALGFVENGVAQKFQKGMVFIGYALENGRKNDLVSAITTLPNTIA
jgi:hypothetical protein